MFSFKALSEEQIQEERNKARGLMPVGTYPFQVKNIEAQISNSNNPMLKVTLLFKYEGSERIVVDYLLTTTKMIFKLKHFLESIGLGAQYESETVHPEMCKFKTGQAMIDIEKGGAKPDGSGYYPDKNKVKDYVKQVMAMAATDFKDSEIPF